MRVIPSPQKQYNADPTTTFGPLEKYVAANDNHQPATHVAAGFTGDSAGNLRSTTPPTTGGQYIGLMRQAKTHRDFASSVEAWRASTDRTMSGLQALAQLDGYIYLGSPYSKYASHDEAASKAAECAAVLMNLGLVIYAPIPHGHTITLAGDLPKDWAFWKRQCDPMIDAAAALVVLTMDGWQESVGLTYEIATFLVAQKPILYVDPAALLGAEGRVA